MFTYTTVTLSATFWSASNAGSDAIVSLTLQRMTSPWHAHDPKHETLLLPGECSMVDGSLRNSTDKRDKRDE